jgi:hypothetical protein
MLGRAAGGNLGGALLGEPLFTDEFYIEDCKFESKGANRFFSLRPGYQLYLSGIDEEEVVDLYITVLRSTKLITLTIDGAPRRVRARVIEEREFVDGELYEISLNYYAICGSTNSVFYFGEDVCFYEKGECVSTDGSWLAGVEGATPGILMPGTFLLGARYYQEQAPAVAVDRAENAEMGLIVATPAGTFENCVRVLEDSEIDIGATSQKTYAPGVGLIGDDVLQLVDYGFIDLRPEEKK